MDQTRKINRRAALALVASLAFALSGCLGTSTPVTPMPGKAATGKQPDRRRIVLITNGNSDWWSAVEKGMIDGANKVFANVEMKRNGGSVETQIRLLEEALASDDIKAVAISVVEPKAPGISDAMKKLKDAGKFVVTIDSDTAAVETRSYYIGTNNTKAGESAGKAAAILRPQGGTVAVFVGVSSADNARQRLEGFYVGAGPKFLKPPAGVFDDDHNPEKAQSNVQIAITKFKDLGVMLGLYSYNAPRIAAELVTVPDFRKKCNVVTFDLDEQAVEFLEKGDIDVSVCQNPYEIGFQGVEVLKAMIDDDKAKLSELFPGGSTTRDTGVRVIVPSADSPIKGEDVITIKDMKDWLKSKGLKSS